MASDSRLLDRLSTCGLISERELKNLAQTIAGGGDDSCVLAGLVQNGDLTDWQSQALARGRTDFCLEAGRYVLLGEIGHGGMGTVYRARHTRLNRVVALKVMESRSANDPQLRKRFEREVELVARLQHQHIVQALDVGEHAGATFLVLEYVAGCDLATLVRREGSMDAGEAVAICRQAAAGLAYAHGQGIVHRDIKPHNILLSADGVAKVLDLGLARVMDAAVDDHTALTQEGVVMGTIDYMAPEQARDTRLADSRSDIYSLGATLYYLLCGRPPFVGGTAAEKLLRLTSEDPQPLGQLRPELPSGLPDVVHRMLAKAPADRFQTMEDVIRGLEPFASATIAGRPALTSAVQAAGGVFRELGSLPTAAEVPLFEPDLEPATSLLIHRRRTAPTWPVAAAVLLAVSIVAGLMFWRWKRPGVEATTTAAATAAVAPIPGVPPKEIRAGVSTQFFGSVIDAAFSPDGREVAFACTDGFVRIVDLSTRRCRFLYDGHNSGVLNVAWSADGKRVASREVVEGRIHVWNSADGATEFQQPTVVGSVAHVGFALACSTDGRFVVGHNQSMEWTVVDVNAKTMRKLTAATLGDVAHSFRAPLEPLRVAPDGRGFTQVFSDGRLVAWSFDPDRVTVDLEPGVPRDVVFQSADQILVGEPGRLRCFDMHTGAERSAPYKWPEESEIDPETLKYLRFSSTGKQLLCSPNDDAKRDHVLTLATGGVQSRPYPQLTHRAYSPGLDRFACLQSTAIYDPQCGPTLLEFGYAPGLPSTLVSLPWHLKSVSAGRYLMLEYYDALQYFDLVTGETRPRPPKSLRITEDGTPYAVLSGHVVRYQDLDAVSAGKYELVSTLEGFRELPVDVLQWSGDGTRVVGVSNDELAIRVWNSSDGRLLGKLNCREQEVLKFLEGTLGIDSAGRRIVVPSVLHLTCWDVDSGQVRRVDVTPGSVFGIVLSQDGRRCYRYSCPGGLDYSLEVSDCDSGETLWSVKFQDPSIPLRSWGPLSLSPSGRYVALSTTVFDTETGSVAWTCEETSRSRGLFGAEY
ncbi:MAG: protein kinase, partial [Planctomycetaceae bacterium]|nr:protein kinase [Planctomycetaceae bacterium]